MLPPMRSPRNFNPRPPRGGRHRFHVQLHILDVISIHAPREGGDASFTVRAVRSTRFQSTPPARGATNYG